jgi:hypothetical protein
MTLSTRDPEPAAAGDDRLGGLTAAAWDGLAGPHLFSTAAWLKLCALHGGAQPGAAVSFTGGEPTAAVPYAALTAPPFPLYRWNELLAQRELPALAPGGLLVGPSHGYGTHLLVRPGVDRTSAVAQLVEQLRDRARGAGPTSAGRACVAMYVTTSDAQALLAAGVSAPPVLLEADAWLELAPGGWDAWLQTLPSKRRTNVRREAGRFEEAGYTVMHLPLTECYERLPALAGATQAKYGHGADVAVWRELLQMHIAAMGPAARVALCERGGGEPVGFCLYYVRGETLYLRWAGFDYDRLAGAAEYFNLLYYSQIRLAAGLGVRWIHAGIKSLEAKALRGCELRPLWLVDLAEDSPLARHRDAVHAHNARAYERLAADARTRSALRDRDAWLAFA